MYIIGLGNCGCKIAEQFVNHGYKVFQINSDKKIKKAKFRKNECLLVERKSPEEYEETLPDLCSFFRFFEGRNVLFIVGGGGYISACALKILQVLYQKNCIIDILYVKPDLELLNQTRILQERITRSILQEYARSGLFNQLYMVDNLKMYEVFGNQPLSNRYGKLNEALAYSFYSLDMFRNTQSVVDNFSFPFKLSRISTVGYVDVENGQEKLFYDLKKIREIDYYYAINENVIASDGNLLEKTKEQARNKRNGETKISFGIYSVAYPESYAFCIARSSTVETVPK